MLLLLIFDCLFLTAELHLNFCLRFVTNTCAVLLISYFPLLQFRAGIYPLLTLRAAILSISTDSCV